VENFQGYAMDGQRAEMSGGMISYKGYGFILVLDYTFFVSFRSFACAH